MIEIWPVWQSELSSWVLSLVIVNWWRVFLGPCQGIYFINLTVGLNVAENIKQGKVREMNSWMSNPRKVAVSRSTIRRITQGWSWNENNYLKLIAKAERWDRLPADHFSNIISKGIPYCACAPFQCLIGNLYLNEWTILPTWWLLLKNYIH